MIRRPPYNFQIRTGTEGYFDSREQKFKPPQMWAFGRVMRREGTDWVDHGEFSKYSDDGTFTSFTVELIHDTVEANLVINRACYDGGTPFCVCAHVGGNDRPGVALRRWLSETGQTQYRKIECDPEQCDLRLLITTAGEQTSKKLPAIYKEAYRDLKIPKPEQPPTCKAQVCFLFRLLLPDGSDYAHGPYDVCALTTSSDKTRGLLWSKLQELWLETGGHLAGLRLDLRALQWTSSRFKKDFTAWELGTDNQGSVLEQRAAQGRRLQLRNLDPVKVAEESSTALAIIDAGGEYSLAQLGTDETMQAAIDIKKMEVERAAFEAEYIAPESIEFPTRNPFVVRMCDRLNLSHAERVLLVLRHGYDPYRVIVALAKQAKAQSVPFRDIYLAFGESIGEDFNVAAKPAAPKVQSATTEPADADFQEPVPCPRCGADAFPGKDGAVDCPKCGDGQRGIADDMAAVRGEQQTLL